MLRTVSVLAMLLAGSVVAFAQGDGLNDKQRQGRQLLAQSCGVCRVSPPKRAGRRRNSVLPLILSAFLRIGVAEKGPILTKISWGFSPVPRPVEPSCRGRLSECPV